MKSAVLAGKCQFEIRDKEQPSLQQPNDVLLRVVAVGICGSDVHYYKYGRIGDQVVSYPFTIGHECSAVVAVVGSKVHRIKPGDRVFVEPAVSCGQCDQCRRDRRHTCRHLRFLGCPGQLAGALSEYLVMPEENCFLLPKSVSFDQAVLIEPISIALHALQLAGSLTNKTVGILGVGPIGLSVLLTTRIKTLQQIFVSDKIDSRLSAAAAHGADWTGNPDRVDVAPAILAKQPLGLDVVFECCGDQDALDHAVDALAPGGVLILVGIPAIDRVSFNISQIRRKELSVVNVRRQNNCVQAALQRLANRPADFDFMITHRFELNDIVQAFEMVAAYQDGVVKALVKLPSD